MEQEEFEYSGEIVELTKEQGEAIMNGLFEKQKADKTISKEETKRNLIKDKIGFLMSLLGAGISTRVGDTMKFEFLIQDEAYSREQIIKDIIKLKKQFVRL